MEDSYQLERTAERPLHVAASNGKIEDVRELLVRGADINAQDKYGCTPLFGAAADDQVEIVLELLARGADINAQDRHGWTPLHVAAFNWRVEIVRELIAQGADINARDGGGGTPLWRGRSHPDVVRLLLQAGADPRMHTSYDWDLAQVLGAGNGRKSESKVVATMIDEACGRLDASDRREALLKQVSSVGVHVTSERGPIHSKPKF